MTIELGKGLLGGLRVGGFCLGVLAAAARPVAAEPANIKFKGQPVTPDAGFYVATQDAPVRDKPDTNAKRIGGFDVGDRILVVGKAQGSWLAVRKNGKDFGFVYGPVLMPLLDNVPKYPLSGRTAIANGECDWRIIHEGETPIEGQLFNSLDYRARLDCRRGGGTVGFDAPMFITEGPYNGGTNPVHQIGLDVLELGQDYERVFSTNMLYDRDKNEVRFDGLSVDKYRVKKEPAPIAAKNVAEALTAAIAIALQAWSADFWTDLGAALKAAAKR